MPTRKQQNEILKLQDEITAEISRDGPAIAATVFGDARDMPDAVGVDNDRLDAIYRQAYERDDRQWLQTEARRDPAQFMKVAQRIGVRKPQALPGMAPPQSVSGAFAKAAAAAPSPAPALPPPNAPVMPPSLPGAPPTPTPAAMVAPAPAGPVVMPGGPPPQQPVILGPNGQPIRMAQGGVVTHPTLALIGENGPEAVVPLNRQSSLTTADVPFNPMTVAPPVPVAPPPPPAPIRVGQGQEAFIASLTPLARQAEERTGVPADLYLAMAANETGWGRSQTAQQNNLFSVQGPTGGASRWATYESPLESFEKLAELLSTTPRYEKAWAARGDPAQFLTEMKKAGYVADEPGYPAQAWVNQVNSIYNELQARRAREQQTAVASA